ncbi:hypothetical protein FW800_11875 [Pseudomonas sp. 910_23]
MGDLYLWADAKPCGSWLACDADTWAHQVYRGDAIAGKPAPTLDRAQPWRDVAAHWPKTRPRLDSCVAQARTDWMLSRGAPP